MKWTLLLMLANIAVFVLTAQNLDYYVLNYGFSTGTLLAGKYYVILTSMFIHGSILHLAGNMFALLVLGSAVESKTKAWQFLLAYFLTGMFGCLSMFVPLFGYGPDSIAIGASAAISGLVGLGIFVCPGKFVWFPEVVPLPFSLAGAIYFLANVSSVFASGDIAYSAHVFGFLAGAAFGLAWGENRMRSLAIFLGMLVFMILLPSIIPALWAMLSA